MDFVFAAHAVLTSVIEEQVGRRTGGHDVDKTQVDRRAELIGFAANAGGRIEARYAPIGEFDPVAIRHRTAGIAAVGAAAGVVESTAP